MPVLALALLLLLAGCASSGGSPSRTIQTPDVLPPVQPQDAEPASLGFESAAVITRADLHRIHTPSCGHDREGDGIIGEQDQCPNTPSDYPVGTSGCTVDTDCDGVPNHHDHCLNSDPGDRVDEKGCKQGPGPWPDDLPKWPIIYFEVDKADISQAAYTKLNKVLEDMRRYPSLAAVIVGHTDSDQTNDYNERLGILRAYRVRQALLRGGLDSHRLVMESFGEDQPVFSNTNAESKALNRRVEIRPWLPQKDPYLVKHQLRRSTYQNTPKMDPR